MSRSVVAYDALFVLCVTKRFTCFSNLHLVWCYSLCLVLSRYYPRVACRWIYLRFPCMQLSSVFCSYCILTFAHCSKGYSFSCLLHCFGHQLGCVCTDKLTNRHKIGTTVCICCFHVGNKCSLIHRLFYTSRLYFTYSPAYLRSLLFWPRLMFPWPGAHIVFSLKGN